MNVNANVDTEIQQILPMNMHVCVYFYIIILVRNLIFTLKYRTTLATLTVVLESVFAIFSQTASEELLIRKVIFGHE